MFLFLLFGPLLGFALLFIIAYPPEEQDATRRTALRGLVVSLPLWFIARLAGALVPAAWGSPLLVFHEWADRIVPYSLLPLLGYALFWRLDEKLDRGTSLRRMTTFYAWSLGPLGIGEAARSMLSPSLHDLILLPSLMMVIILIMPRFIQAWLEAWTFRKIMLASAFLLGSLAISFPPWLLVARSWYFALALVAIAVGGALLATLPRLRARRPQAT